MYTEGIKLGVIVTKAYQIEKINSWLDREKVHKVTVLNEDLIISLSSDKKINKIVVTKGNSRQEIKLEI